MTSSAGGEPSEPSEPSDLSEPVPSEPLPVEPVLNEPVLNEPVLNERVPLPVEPLPDRRRGPDYRFSLANERTFLAWIRTALAFLAGALAVGALDTELDRQVADVLRSVCLVVAAVIAANSYRRWAVVQSAMTAGTPMPPHPLLRPIALAVVLACIAIGVAFLR